MTDKLKHSLTNGTSTILFRGFVTLSLTFLSGVGLKGCNDWDEMRSDMKVMKEWKSDVNKKVTNLENAIYFGKKKSNEETN